MLREPVRKAPIFVTLLMGNRGVQSGAELPYLLTKASPKNASVASILATEAQAPSPRSASLREQKRKPTFPAMSLILTIHSNRENMQKFCKNNSKRNKAELVECSLGTFELRHPPLMENLPSQNNSHNTRLQTGNRLQRSPNIPSFGTAEKHFGYAML